MITFRKEVGLSEIIAFGALVISGMAFWYSTQSNEGHIIQGGGTVRYSILNESSCIYAMSIPVEFHNSGKKTVALKQLAPADSVQIVLFSRDKKIVIGDEISHKIYLSNSGVGAVPSLWLKKMHSQTEFEPNYNHIDDLIYPGDSYSFNIIILIEPYSQFSEYSNSSVLVAFNAVFSNGQNLPVRSSVGIDKYHESKCRS